ncbi:MAG: hypothetical protein ACI4W6_10130 [Acutalibacteraceae bacterium]
MSKIKVNTENLETALAGFIQASKEAQEIHYRLQQLGNELTEDVDLLVSDEYEAVMLSYSAASAAVNRMNDLFDALLFTVTKIPQMYYDAESKSVDKIHNLAFSSSTFQKSVIDDSALAAILEKIDSENVNISEIAQLVDKSCQSVALSGIAAESLDIDSFEKAEANSTN